MFDKIISNGLKVICMQKNNSPVVSVQVWYKTGSVNEHDGIRGISHMVEHMMFRGSEKVASGEHARRINCVGGHCNAYTAEDVTVYTNSVPKQHLNMVLELESGRMSGLLLDKEILKIERNVVIEEYYTYMTNQVATAFMELRAVLYENHPYKISPLGTIEDIKTVSVDDMMKYFQSWYNPNNAVLVVVGDFENTEVLMDMVEKAFGDIQNEESGSKEKQSTLEIPLNSQTGIFMKRKVDFDVPILLAGYPAPASSHKDTLSLDVLQMIISQGESSRLHKEIVRKRSLAVMAGGMNCALKHAGMSLFFAAFTPDISTKRIGAAINGQIADVIQNGISDREMEKVKNIMLTARTFELYNSEHLCQRIGQAETFDGDYRIWTRKFDELESLKRDRLMTVAEKYWQEERKYTLYLQPKKVNPLFFALGLVRRIMPIKAV